MHNRLTVLAMFLCVSQFCPAQEACSALLEHGIYDHFRQSNVSNSAAQMKSQICEAYSKLQQSSSNVSASGHYGVIGGSVSAFQCPTREHWSIDVQERRVLLGRVQSGQHVE